MKKIILTCLFLVTGIISQAQFTFKGTINNYSNKRILVKINRAFDDLLIGNTITNSVGSFSIPIKEKYSGIIEISLLDAKKNYIFISDNTDIDFSATVTTNDEFIINIPGNHINDLYQNYLNYDIKKNSILAQLQNIDFYYNSKDDFYLPLQNEIQRISVMKQPNTSEYPFLSYYLKTSELIKNTEIGIGDAISNKNLILNHFKNAGQEFETSGLGKSLLYNYFKLSVTGASTQKDWENKIDKAIEILLDEVGEETGRGQELLSASINFLNGYGMENLSNKYMKRAESLTCEISSELKETIKNNNSIKEGKIIPNIKFTHKLNNKYAYLHDIKSKYKLIMVWASWCSHCQQELPFIKQFYENFKKSGGEIIGLSVDFNKEDWQNAIKETSWLNDSDLLYWDSKFAKELNITGTPTLFLVDQKNKILKITSKISDINNLIK
jgi:thiol-disulfide isomerase/thioredoxin